MVKFYFIFLTTWLLCFLSFEGKAQQAPSTGSTLEVLSITSDSFCLGGNTAHISFVVSDTIHTYTINFDTNAENAGFMDITDTVLVDSVRNITIPIPTTANAGTYTATINITDTTNANTNTSDNFDIILYQLPTPTLTIVETSGTTDNDGVICSSDSVTLKISGGINYTWSNNSTSDSIRISPTTFTIYTVTVTNSNQCSNSISTSINVDPTPVMTPVLDQTVCSNAFTTPINFSNTSSIAGVTYNWINDNTQGIPNTGTGGIPPFIPENTTNTLQQITFTVTPSTNTCVGDSINFNIIAKPIPTVDAIPNQTFCNETATQSIYFNSTFDVATTTYNWTNNSTITGLNENGLDSIPIFNTTNSLDFPIASIITVTPMADGCIGDSKTFDIIVNPSPTAFFVAATHACKETPITFDASSSTGFATIETYQWNFDNNNNSQSTNSVVEESFDIIGDYNVILTIADSNNCNDSISQTIAITPKPNFLRDTVLAASNEFDEFEITIDPSELTYIWNLTYQNIDNAAINANDNGDSYVLTANDGFRLTDSRANGLIKFKLDIDNCDLVRDNFELVILRGLSESNTLSAPNTFTPNSDGINDTWQIKGIVEDPSAYTITIYNRNGAEVAQLNSLNDFWDGSGLPSGAYVYIVMKGNTQVKHGTITLLN